MIKWHKVGFYLWNRCDEISFTKKWCCEATPSSRAFVIGTTLLTEAGSKFLHNSINDPKYFKSQMDNFKGLLPNTPSTKIGGNSKYLPQDHINFIPNKDGVDSLGDNLFKQALDYFSSILNPVQVDYSNQLLADQLYSISIILFIMAIFITFLLVVFIFNIIVFIYSDKINNFFNNKYIKWYINFNKKIIGIELILSGPV